MSRKVVIANDHGAFELAFRIKEHLEKHGYEVDHLGVYENISVDYPDQAEKACRKYLEGGYEFGIVCCGTGIGISIAANKIKGIRCALVQDSYCAEMTKRHNNANFLAFGGRVEYKEPVENILDAYLNAVFEGGRHSARIEKIHMLENK